MNLRISAIQKTGNHFRALFLWIVGLIVELSILLIALSRKAHVVELHLIHSRLGHKLRQSDIVILHRGIRRVSPDQLAVFAPGLPAAVRLYGQLRMACHQMLVSKDGDARDGVHVLGMQKVYELRQVRNIVALARGQGMVERDIDDAVAILDVEHDRVAPDFAPMSDNAHPMVAARHHSR